MSTAKAIVVSLPVTADLAGTKEDLTYSPEQISPELSTFVHRPSDGLVIGTHRVSVRFTPASKQRNYAKATMAIAMPRTGTTQSGATGVVSTPRVSIEVQLPEASTSVDRARLSVLVNELLAEDLVSKALFDLDPIY